MTKDDIIEEIQFGTTRAELASKMGLTPAKLDVLLSAIGVKWKKVPHRKPTPGRVASARSKAKKAYEASAETHKTKTAFGVTDSYIGLHRRFGLVSLNCFQSRIRKGMELEEALTRAPIPQSERNAKA